MALLLRVARRSLAPATALYRPRRSALFQSAFSAFSTTPVGAPETDDDVAPARKLTRTQRLALLPATVKAFHARHGHFIMNYGYTIPQEDDSGVYPDLLAYPDAARGLKLGTTLHWLLVNANRRRKDMRAIEELKAIGFPVDVNWEQYVWEHQRLPALRVYQELYGDLVVPSTFVVPTGNKRWPIETWGFKLGTYAMKIKSRDHRTLPRKHLEDLDQLNASWHLKELTPAQRLGLLVPTLKVFHAKYGHFVMPHSFVVPTDEGPDAKQVGREENSSDEAWPGKARGENLGRTLHAFLLSKSQREGNQDLVEALSDIGFPVHVDWKDYVFERQQLAAFRAYQEVHGDCQVPQSYVVPTGDARWPIETWGFNLGTYAHTIRSRAHRSLTQEQLNALAAVGLPLNLNELPFAERLPLLAPTLRAFQARYGHYIMNAGFIVPSEDNSDENPHLPPYPPETRGVNIGMTLHRLLVSEQRRQKHPNVLQELKETGFPVEVNWSDYVFERQALAAFRAYREVHGHCCLTKSFVVPTGDTGWPIETWGFQLGVFFQFLQHRKHRSLKQEQLDALAAVGLSLKLNELSLAERLPLLAPTLKAFHARHGHFIMHANFVVPKEDDSDANPHVPPYPAETRGAKLGSTLHRLLVRDQSRQKHSDVLQELAEIGFPVGVNWRDYVFEHQVLAAFRVYRELHGDCRVPILYVVPAGDTRWPVETWGCKLGRYADRIRQRGDRLLTQEQRDQLNKLGFWWGQRGTTEREVPVVETDEQK